MGRRTQTSNPFTLFAFQDIITSVTGILILITLILALTMVVQPENFDASSGESVETLRANLQQLEDTINAIETQSQVDQMILDLLVEFDADSMEQLDSLLTRSSKETKEKITRLKRQYWDDKTKAQSTKKELEKKRQQLSEIENQNKKKSEALKKLQQSERVEYGYDSTGGEEPWLIYLSEKQWMCARVNQKQPPIIFSESDLSKRLSRFENWQHGITLQKSYFVLFVRPDGVPSYDLIRGSVRLSGVEFGVELLNEKVVIIDPQTGTVIQ